MAKPRSRQEGIWRPEPSTEDGRLPFGNLVIRPGDNWQQIKESVEDHAAPKYGWIGYILKRGKLPAVLSGMVGITQSIVDEGPAASNEVNDEIDNDEQSVNNETQLDKDVEKMLNEMSNMSPKDYDNKDQYNLALEVLRFRLNVLQKEKEAEATKARNNRQFYYNSYHEKAPMLIAEIEGKLTRELVLSIHAKPTYHMAIENCDLLGFWKIIRDEVRSKLGQPKLTRLAIKREIERIRKEKGESIVSFNERYLVKVATYLSLDGKFNDNEDITYYLRALENTEVNTIVTDFLGAGIEESDDVSLQDIMDKVSLWDKRVHTEGNSYKEVVSSNRMLKTVVDDEETKSDNKKKRTCLDFIKPGGCRYGDGCKFSHDVNSGNASYNNINNNKKEQKESLSGAKLTKKDIPCKYYSKTGNCNRGSNCEFSHAYRLVSSNTSGGNQSTSESSSNSRSESSTDSTGKSGTGIKIKVSMVSANRYAMLGCEMDEEGALLLDTGSNVNVVKDKELCETIANEVNIISIEGIDKVEFETESMECQLKQPFNRMVGYYCPNVSSNVISEGDITKHFHKEYDSKRDVYVFKEKEDLTNKVEFRRNKDRFYTCKHNGKRIIKKGYLSILTKPDIEKCMVIDDIHRGLGYCGLDNIRKLNQNNVLREYNISERDINNYEKHYHKENCKGCALGKTSEHPAVSSTVKPTYDIGGLIHMDIFYITKDNMDSVMYIVAVDEASLHIMCEPVASRHLQSIKDAVNNIIKDYQFNKHPVLMCKFDREKSFFALKDHLHGLGIKTTYHHHVAM